MDEMEPLEGLARSLLTLAAKGTVTSVEAKIKAMQVEQDIEKLKNKYDEIVSELLAERSEAIRIAQVYKNEIEKYEISDKDIEHLHNTVNIILDIIQKMSPDIDLNTYKSFKDLISVDTLKAVQLLGFNYKAAIGEPLTEICKNVILNKGKLES